MFFNGAPSTSEQCYGLNLKLSPTGLCFKHLCPTLPCLVVRFLEAMETLRGRASWPKEFTRSGPSNE